MMKVLLCERNFKGHRQAYMDCLSQISGVEIFLLAPENIGVDEYHFIKYEIPENMKSIMAYFQWINQIRNIIVKNKIQIVHILDGDSIMRFFGIGFGGINADKIVITYHHFFSGILQKLSYRIMCHGKSRICVVHTHSIEQSLIAYGVKNIIHCEYPAFNYKSISERKKSECKSKYGIPTDVPTIGIIGGLSTYKNIIPFLEIMKKCNNDFHILICGKESGISEKMIKSVIQEYKGKVTLLVKLLSHDEYEDAIVASDIIYCIYGHNFDGASGPLTDGVCANKMILSCKHGSLGEIVSQNSLGVTAECDNSEEILNQTELALQRVKDFRYDDMAKKYLKELNPYRFQQVYKKIYIDIW